VAVVECHSCSSSLTESSDFPMKFCSNINSAAVPSAHHLRWEAPYSALSLGNSLLASSLLALNPLQHAHHCLLKTRATSVSGCSKGRMSLRRQAREVQAGRVSRSCWQCL
jgi:hypothetical protein